MDPERVFSPDKLGNLQAAGLHRRRCQSAILLVYTYILMQHMIGGIRHLIWDFGYGMEPGTRMNMARATPIAAAILTVLIWAVAFLTR